MFIRDMEFASAAQNPLLILGYGIKLSAHDVSRESPTLIDTTELHIPLN